MLGTYEYTWDQGDKAERVNVIRRVPGRCAGTAARTHLTALKLYNFFDGQPEFLEKT